MPVGSMMSVRYTGSSMSPFLKSLDSLRVIPYNGRNIRRGDVIVFRHPGEHHKVTHRVISVDSGTIRTRGDNNPHADEWVLNPGDIIGRVVSARRKNRRVRVYGGLAGRIIAYVFRLFLLARLRLYSLFRPVYLKLAKSGIFRRFLPVKLKTRVVSFKRPSGVELQLLIGKRAIGWRRPGQNHWNIRPPFRLFIDEASLPAWDGGHTRISKARKP